MAFEEFFENLKQQPPEKTQGVNSSYVFDIEGAGKWKVDVKDDSGVSVSDAADGDDAACTLSASEETFQKIISGEQNATSAYMTGKLKIRGDMGAAMKLQKLFA